MAGVVQRGQFPLARFHALMVLDAIDGLGETNVLRALRDTDPTLRRLGVRLAENFIHKGSISEALWAQLRSMTGDPSIQVRHQLALTLGGIQRAERFGLLAGLLRRDARNVWMQSAVLSSLPDGADRMLQGWARDPARRTDQVGVAFLTRLADMIGVRGQAGEVSSTIDLLAGNALPPNLAFQVLQALGQGLQRAGSSIALADPAGRLTPLFNQAKLVAVDDSLIPDLRLNAIAALEFLPQGFADSGDVLLLLFGSGQPDRVQAAAISSLCAYREERVGSGLLARWRLLGPALRREAVAGLLTWEDRVGWVLDAAVRGQIQRGDFPLESVQFLRTHSNPAVAAAATRLFGPPGAGDDAIERFLPALRLNPISTRGHEVFRSRCIGCHRLAGEGERVGPDLDGARALGREKLLFAILEPGVRTRPGQTAQVLRAAGGECYVGLVENANPLTVTLVSPGGVRWVFPRINLQSVTPQAWSVMPEGLETGLTPQDMANLLGYLVATPR